MSADRKDTLLVSKVIFSVCNICADFTLNSEAINLKQDRSLSRGVTVPLTLCTENEKYAI